MCHSIWSLYSLFRPVPCPPDAHQCLKSYLDKTPRPPLKLWVYSSLVESPSRWDLDLLWELDDFNPAEDVTKDINVTITTKTRNNGTLYVHVFVVPSERGRGREDPFVADWRVHQMGELTTYAVPRAATFQLVSEKPEDQKPVIVDRPISHWRSHLTVNVMADDVIFDSKSVPGELLQYMRLFMDEYLPILFIDEISYRSKDLMPLNETCKEMPLAIIYTPISYGKLRLWANMKESLKMLTKLGFTDKDMDEVKGLFVDTNLYLLLLTFLVAAFHLLFDFLAFKSDINYWRKRETMVGLSSRTVVWRCVSTMVIFLYLMDEQTSLLVLIPAGIGSVIEIWKVLKAFKVTVSWSKWIPVCEVGNSSDQERATQALDSQAMKYLSYVLYPLCAAGAIYSLIYTPHKSWYSWCIQSLVNGVYAFGFIFMLPQLFINYKMKSVAHLPWRAFMYKAFNTFIDDVFAFIISMPTAHRLACFRDDVIFIIYLYQRWLYPVDKTRVNEFGQSFEGEVAATNDVKQKPPTASSSSGDLQSKKKK